MPRVAKEARPKDEHIFPETKIRPLVQTWKRLIQQNRQREAMVLLDEIIVDSTEMFKRLAQHEKFHHTVPLDSLVAAAQEKIPKWLTRWDPAKGSLFSWLSTCAKNVFRSELVKTTTFTRRIHCTDDDSSLERLSGFTGEGQDSKEKTEEIMLKIQSMACPWWYEEIRQTIRYIIECILQDEHSKQDCIRGAAFAWGMSFDTAKFLYNWTHVEMKIVLFSESILQFTEQDIFRAVNRHSGWPQVLDIIGWKAMRMLVACMGGQRLKVPTSAEMSKSYQDAIMAREMAMSDNDPESRAKVAKKFGKSEKSASEIYTEMIRVLDPAVCGEFPIYDTHEESKSADGDEFN